MDEIMNRTSVRQYLDKPVSSADIEKILKAGMAAPSAVNKQPWELIVITKKQELEQLANFSPYAQALKQAVFAVVVCADENRSYKKEYDVQDLSALSENMLIEAKSLGIGGVWLGGYPEEERIEWLKKHFDLPQSIVPYWVLSFGYPLHEQKPMNKWDLNKIHYNGY